MATRRSRIKAVANLPARRNRPLPIDDIKREDPDKESNCTPSQLSKDTAVGPSISSSQLTDSVEAKTKDVQPAQSKDIADENSSNHQSQNIDILQSLPDRKSVIVSIDKDRKSVIVNRERTLSENTPEKPQDNEVPVEKSADASEKQSSGLQMHSEKPSVIEVLSLKSSNSEVCSKKIPDAEIDVAFEKQTEGEVILSAPGTDAKAVQSKRVPIRGRRPKPTVNLSAAARKRPANDSSPCSPPLNKIRGSEPFQHKPTENGNTPESDSSSVINNKCHQAKSCELKEKPINKSSMQLSDPSPPTSPPPRSGPGHCAPNKTSPITNGHFKVPVSPTSKIKDPVPGPSNDGLNGNGPSLASPQKETSAARRKQSSSAQRAAAARKNLKSRFSTEGPPPRSALTMFDLIFYNPSQNPMKSSDSSTTKHRGRLSSVSSISSIHEDRLNEESVDDVEEDKRKEDSPEDTAMPVPRVKVGPDGSLILDEQSLVIETTGTKESREELEKSEVVVDTGSNYGHYKKIIRSKDWSDHETKKFYRALNVVGTDFSLMKPYFRNRTRRELKLKFKKEERLNPNLVNKALAEPLDFDITELEKEIELEDEEEKRLEEEAKEKAAEKLSEKVAKNGDNKVKRPVSKKKAPKRSVLYAEMEVEAENISVSSHKTSQVTAKKIRKQTEADADYNILAEGVNSENGLPNKKPKKKICTKTAKANQPERNICVKTAEANQEPKKIEDDSINRPKPKRSRKKPEASIVTGSQMRPSETKGASYTSTTVISQSTSLLSATQASQMPVLGNPSTSGVSTLAASNSGASTSGASTSGVLTAGASTSAVLTAGASTSGGMTAGASTSGSTSGTRFLPTTPLSRIRTVQASPQITPPIPGFGMTTPVSKLLPSTPPLPRMEPGSIIVLKTPLPQNPDRHILQVYMVTNTPSGNATSPLSTIAPGINLIPATSLQSPASRVPCISDDSVAGKVLTKL